MEKTFKQNVCLLCQGARLDYASLMPSRIESIGRRLGVIIDNVVTVNQEIRAWLQTQWIFVQGMHRREL